jgi:hypothetical protein
MLTPPTLNPVIRCPGTDQTRHLRIPEAIWGSPGGRPLVGKHADGHKPRRKAGGCRCSPAEVIRRNIRELVDSAVDDLPPCEG